MGQVAGDAPAQDAAIEALVAGSDGQGLDVLPYERAQQRGEIVVGSERALDDPGDGAAADEVSCALEDAQVEGQARPGTGGRVEAG